MKREDFINPTEPAVMLVLWLYTIEPPIYDHLNRISRDMEWKNDPKLFETLGPFAFGIHFALGSAQKRRQKPQPLFPQLGKEFEHMFVVIRGARMKKEWLKGWEKAVGGKNYHIPGLSSTSKDPRVAIERFCHDEGDKSKISVLFFFAMRTFRANFSMDTEEYTYFPDEKEILLTEGCPVKVLKCEDIYSAKYDRTFKVFYSVSHE